MLTLTKRVLIGRPLATSEQTTSGCRSRSRWPTFSSDAISSTAYATEEILFVIAVGASSLALGLSKLVPIAIVVAVLLAIVVGLVPADDLRLPERRRLLHRQPREPRREPVARRRRVAARRLHPHRRGVGLLRRRRHHLDPDVPRPRAARVPLCVVLVAARHARQPARHQGVGSAFAVPTYVYIVAISAMVVIGLWRVVLRRRRPGAVRRRTRPTTSTGRSAARSACSCCCAGFSSGAVALTGVEAISNGVPAFRRPESQQRGDDPHVDGGDPRHRCSSALSVLASHLHPYPSHDETVISQMGRALFGERSFYWVIQFVDRARSSSWPPTPPTPTSRGCRRSSPATATCPASSPTAGDRLVFSNGIVFLAVAASVLIVVFGGIVTALIPLYAIGVFTRSR